MYTFLLVLLILDALILVGAVLLQAGKGSGLAANFGGASSTAETLIGSRQAGNLLTKASWWCGGIFIGLSFILQILGTTSRAPRSVLDQAITAPANSAPTTPSGAAPAVPLTPAPTPAAPAPAPGGTPPAPRP